MVAQLQCRPGNLAQLHRGGTGIGVLPELYLRPVQCRSVSAKHRARLTPDACVACSAGLIAAVGSSTCTGCPPGRWASNNESDTEGGLTVQVPSEATVCNACPMGTFAPTASSLLCQSCLPGKFSGEAASASCLACEAGTFSAQGSSYCASCEAGKVSVIAGSSSCDECSGETSSIAGSVECDRCIRGYYMSLEGECGRCPEGASCEYDGASTQEYLTINKDWWRISSNSHVLYECPLVRACAGGEVFENGYCHEGFEGPLCAVCKNGYYLNHDAQTCWKCEAIENPV